MVKLQQTGSRDLYNRSRRELRKAVQVRSFVLSWARSRHRSSAEYNRLRLGRQQRKNIRLESSLPYERWRDSRNRCIPNIGNPRRPCQLSLHTLYHEPLFRESVSGRADRVCRCQGRQRVIFARTRRWWFIRQWHIFIHRNRSLTEIWRS